MSCAKINEAQEESIFLYGIKNRIKDKKIE